MDGNSSSTPSPVVFTTLPPWLATVGSTAVRCPRRTRAVPPHRRPLADCSRRHRRPGSARASARSRALPECHRAAPPAPFYTDHRTGCRARGRPKRRQVEPSDCGKSKFWLVKCAGALARKLGLGGPGDLRRFADGAGDIRLRLLAWPQPFEDLGTLMRSELRRPTGLTATGVARTTFSLDRYCAYRSTRIGPFTSGAIDASGARGANGAHTNTHQRAWQSWSTRDWIPRRH